MLLEINALIIQFVAVKS